MVTITALWLPIILSAVLVFAASSVIHMFLGYHGSDHVAVPSEDRVRRVLREASIPPGDYVIPRAETMKEMSDPAFIAKQEEGPVAILTVRPNESVRLGPMLVQWFLFLVVVSVAVAYLSGRTLGPGVEYLDVFRVTGTTAFLAYAAAEWPRSIWYGRKWSTTLKNTFDGFVYALLTAGTFGGLWP